MDFPTPSLLRGCHTFSFDVKCSNIVKNSHKADKNHSNYSTFYNNFYKPTPSTFFYAEGRIHNIVDMLSFFSTFTARTIVMLAYPTGVIMK